MFGNLFEEDYSSVSNNHYGKGKKLKTKALEPPAPREFTNLSGIRNQGGTCYLNSLLQTLLFTPEFREALFSLGPEELGYLEDKDKPDAKVRIIPLQLQRLFAQLLLLDQEAASTADLTDSFGWTCDEEMRQHDVQELNRILFSALETSLVGTSGHDLINRLYHGTIVNQIVCKECKNISEKQEDFLDLTVAVKNVSGLEDALWNMYVEEEVFDHDNLYHCGTCDQLVKATKSAKLRKLPPFLTISLLRFNFDFVKCERYKETSCYTFPLRINLRPFCEQSELDDLEYTYDLFSVIIHKGGCYGGHYHAYIKDVDHLGNWQFQEESIKPDVNLKALQSEAEVDDPLMILRTILLQESSLIPVDQLSQKLLEKTGLSWNKKYRKQHGPLRKFLQLHSEVFLLSPDESTVCLLKSSSAQADPDTQGNHEQDVPVLASEPPGLSDNTTGPHWFDINDSKVQPIKEKDITQQFQGKESAYMLFYRKSKLQRPSEARANPRYRVPCHLLKEMDAANTELQMKRTECDSADNKFELHLHLGPHYHFFNGALHPIISETESVWDMTFDKRKTLGDLRQSIFQLLEFWEGDMVLSVAKRVPAGLHVYQTLDGDELTLCEADIADGEDIFVWNGVEVGGVHIQTGADCEPLLLHVLHPEARGEGTKCEQLVESPHVFPANAEVGSVFRALAIPVDSVLMNRTESSDGEYWTTIPKEDMEMTFKEQGLKNGSLILVQHSSSNDNSVLPGQSKWISSMDETNWLQVRNLCHLESEEKQVKIPATGNTVVFDIRIKAIKELKLMKELDQNTCLRPIDRNGKLLCPLPDRSTLKEAEVKMGSSLGLCLGKAPTSSQLFLFFALGTDIQPGTEMEVVVEETLSVRDVVLAEYQLSSFRLFGAQPERITLKNQWLEQAPEQVCRARPFPPGRCSAAFGAWSLGFLLFFETSEPSVVNPPARKRLKTFSGSFCSWDIPVKNEAATAGYFEDATLICLKIMLEQSGQQGKIMVCLWVMRCFLQAPQQPWDAGFSFHSQFAGDTWHLRKMDWCYEAGEPLCEEDATLKELMICSGDTLLLTEGKLPPAGFLKVPIWWYRPPGLSGHCKSWDQTPSQSSSWGAAPSQGAPGHIPPEVSLFYLGDVEISEDAMLVELKSQAMTLPSALELSVWSPARLRAWTVESRRPSRLLRTHQQPLKEYKLGRRVEICLEPLQKEENLSPQDVLLRTQLRIPGERVYAPAMDLVWNTTRGWTASSLRQRVADFYSLPVEKIEIAKYFPEKFEWLPISSWNQQIAKRKKKKKQDTLQGGPYYLKDGDIIGVKNLLVEDDDDFSTIRDDVGKENQKQLALGKKKSREVLRSQSSDIFFTTGTSVQPRGPEASLSIHVGSFK